LAYIDSRRGPKFGASTAEHYRRDFMWFCNWLLAEGHIDRRPFGRRDKFKGELHHRRRVLSSAEKARLLESAGSSKKLVYRLPGSTRRLIYWTALVTGFRSGELQFLTVASLQGDRLKLAGEFTKNGDDADQPLTTGLAAALRAFVEGKPPESPLFGKWDRGAKMLRADLRAAGIPYETPDGKADFHALRHSFCTDLFAAGVDAKTAHVLMRHKSIEMTMSYAKTDDARKLDAIGRLDRADFSMMNAAVEQAGLPPPDSLSSTGADEPEVSVERLFGTDDLGALEMLGQIEINERGEIVLAFGPCQGTVLGTVEMIGGTKVNQPVINPDPKTDSPQVGDTEGFGSAPRRTRTYNPLIKRRHNARAEKRRNPCISSSLRDSALICKRVRTVICSSERTRNSRRNRGVADRCAEDARKTCGRQGGRGGVMPYRRPGSLRRGSGRWDGLADTFGRPGGRAAS
jgi:integrase